MIKEQRNTGVKKYHINRDIEIERAEYYEQDFDRRR